MNELSLRRVFGEVVDAQRVVVDDLSANLSRIVGGTLGVLLEGRPLEILRIVQIPVTLRRGERQMRLNEAECQKKGASG